MIPAIQPPTDNIYKFIAIVGLVSLTLSIWYPLDRMDALNIQIVRSNAESSRLEVERVALSQTIEELQAEAKHFSSTTAPTNVDKSGALTQRSEQLMERALDFKLKATELKGKQAEIELLRSQLNVWQFVCGLGAIGGAIIAVWGFNRWYVLWQKPQDAAILKQAQ